ncbi:MAG TPA: phosphate ABC transporter substrate-binding/OmpA family protein [Thermohalobaculum sp.]|nr:phosphate ABC transporter substrate-binding/OmpA family protein [Thermohalobaculum sp.]
MASRLAWLAAALAALALAQGAARAEPVTLRSHDGATQVSGELIDFDGTTYTVRTGVGTIIIEAAHVICDGEGCPRELVYGERFGIAGSSLIGEGLMPALVEGYADTLDARLLREVGTAARRQVLRLLDAEEREVAAIDLSTDGTAAGFAALAAGSAAIALASRRAADAEAGEAALAGQAGQAGLRGSEREHILALDGLILVVHPDNPVDQLTLDQAAALFAGRIRSWAQLGGAERPVSLYLPPSGSGTLETFERLVMAPRDLGLADSAERVEGNANLADLVSIDPSGIGVTGFAFARAAKTLAIRQQCGLLARADRFSIKTEEYPLARRLYAYPAEGPLPSHAEGLLGFALSDAAQPVIAGAGFVDRAVESQGIEAQGGRLVHSLTSPEEFSFELLREMLGELREARRLSATFRFTRGSTDLEARSQTEAERLARRVAAGDYAGQEILLVGFADSVGEFEVNRDLARRRAEAVLEALTAAVPEGALAETPIGVRSYGELTPVGCNETPAGRELNRRVEVWVREAG